MARSYLDSESAVCPVLIAASELPLQGDTPWGLGSDPVDWLSWSALRLAGAGIRPARALITTLRSGQAHVFVDGLDEVPEARPRSRIVSALDYMQREIPSLKICVSSRPATPAAGPLHADVVTHSEMLAVARLLITARQGQGIKPAGIAGRLDFRHPGCPYQLEPLHACLPQLADTTQGTLRDGQTRERVKSAKTTETSRRWSSQTTWHPS
jgi:hypothetical protein